MATVYEQNFTNYTTTIINMNLAIMIKQTIHNAQYVSIIIRKSLAERFDYTIDGKQVSCDQYKILQQDVRKDEIGLSLNPTHTFCYYKPSDQSSDTIAHIEACFQETGCESVYDNIG